ncbi:MAG: tryptophan 7-halogenase [Sandaracinaceae bacterium]|nr:tryptophan 7-halogenase [Sandaracinaceae bacterium]
MNASARPSQADFDLVICGGGLAGLALALQVRAALPDASVAVLERQARPLPLACHKVGESAVELGSHYYAQVLGLADYLEKNHLFKNGLRFFGGSGREPLHTRTEIGPTEFPVLHSYQIDRGRFENDLRAMVEDAGATLIEGAVVGDITLTPPGELNRVAFKRADGTPAEFSCHWVTDASGRGRRIQKLRDARIPADKHASSAWFRVKGRLGPGDLVPKSEEAWHARDVDDNRWLSTSHLMGKGYWVWLIPLATGYTSVGVVTDALHHELTDYNKEPRMRAWLERFEPAVARAVADREFEDFRMYSDYPYRSRESFSLEGWSSVGEASLFIDPLYSMGNDFIGLGNTLTTRMLAEQRAGTLTAELVEELQAFYLHWAKDMDRTLSGNSLVFPHSRIFGAKLWWDFAIYWSFHCPYYFDKAHQAPLAEHKRFHAMRGHWAALNRRAQHVLETWAALMPTEHSNGPAHIPLPMYPSVLVDLHLELQHAHTREESLARMESNLTMGRDLVGELIAHALRSLGPDKAREFGERVGSGPDLEHGLELTLARAQADSLPRRERNAAMPQIGRDLERALGREAGEATLEELYSVAFPGASELRSAS